MPRQRHVIRRRQHRKTPRMPKRELSGFVDRDGTPVDLEILDKDKRIVGVRPRSPWGLSMYETVEEAAA